MIPVNFYGRVVDSPTGRKWVDTQVSLLSLSLFSLWSPPHTHISVCLSSCCRWCSPCHTTTPYLGTVTTWSIHSDCGQLRVQSTSTWSSVSTTSHVILITSTTFLYCRHFLFMKTSLSDLVFFNMLMNKLIAPGPLRLFFNLMFAYSQRRWLHTSSTWS